MPRTITVPVEMTAQRFRAFASFDAFRHQKRWRRPALFALIMLALAVLCFIRAEQQHGAVILGILLAVVGIGLPAAYVGGFFHSVTEQVNRMGLTRPRIAYRVELGPDGITVHVPGRQQKTADATVAWANVWGVYRTAEALYLYVRYDQAYILPDDQVRGGSDALWELCSRMLPAEKLHNCR
nr:YcxB family protein [uncultured Gemmiger sp.]